MITLGDCIGMSGLTEDELQVIAEHEHVPIVVAAEVGFKLLQTPKGIYTLRQYILESLELAAASGQRERERHLRNVLAHFSAKYPVRSAL